MPTAPTDSLSTWAGYRTAIPRQPGLLLSVALPAEPRGEKKLFFVQILGGEKLLKFGEKWAVKNF